MDEQRRAAALERLEHRAEPLVAGRAAERAGRHARAREPLVEQPGQRAGSGSSSPTEAQAPNGRRQRRDARVVGRQQRLGLAGGQRLDAERRPTARSARAEPVRLRERSAAIGIVVGEVDRCLRLALRAAASSPGTVHQHRRLAALRQSAQQRLGPQVLVDVGRWDGCVKVLGDAVH